MTEARAAEARIQESEDRFRTIFNAVNDGIIVYDVGTTAYIDANPRVCDMFGYTREEFLELNLSDLLTGVSRHTLEDAAPLLQGMGSDEALTFEWHCKAGDGHNFWAEVSFRRAMFGARAVLLARYDILTGLSNRGFFVDALEQAIARARRSAKSFAVLYLDLDHFKDVNDTLGHPVGDLLLRAAAERLRTTVRKVDTVGRFGGDEFAVILTDIADLADAALVSDRILDAIGQPIFLHESVAAAGVVAGKIVKAVSESFLIQGNEILSGASVGIAVFGPDPPDAETVLSHADVALYRAKSEGRGTYCFFTDAMDTDVRARVSMNAELREAIASDQLFLMYQPQVEIDTGRIVGLEALVRWQHPKRGVVRADQFIPAAERSGLIVALGHWVIREACRQTKQWLDAGIAPPLIAVNLSGVQFKRPLDLENDIAAILEESGLPPRLLELELTESVFMEVSQEHNDVLLRLRKMGLRIAIDDFGSGYSSLNYLRLYPADRIKIAQTFIRDIGREPGNDAIVRAAIGLAHELGMKVVVEGVETAAQVGLLKAWGCRIVQGYYFAKPLGVPEVAALLGAGAGMRISNAKEYVPRAGLGLQETSASPNIKTSRP